MTEYVPLQELHAMKWESTTFLPPGSARKSLYTDIDGIVQMGTNLSMLRLADEAERWLKKPVIAINAATWWYALRHNDIGDRIYGCGRLLREF